MPLIKNIFLPAMWAILPNLTILNNYTNPSPLWSSFANAPYALGNIGVLYQNPFLFTKEKHALLPWKDPNRISFIEMQKVNKGKTLVDENSSFSDAIVYEAADSIKFDLKKQHFNIYGASNIVYGDIKLTADHILLDGSTGTIWATGKVNEDGKTSPKPVLQQGDNMYVAAEIKYNFQSKRGTAKKLFTKQEEALIRCKNAKIDTPDTYYADRVKFTTCNLSRPHYYIKARKVKFVKDDQIASGPFQFYFDGVPTVLGFFYGIFFIPMAKTSGVLPPQVGEDSKKGFYLRQGGYYFYFSDYIDLALRGSIYTRGDSNFSVESNYKKRYSFKGLFSYVQEITSSPTELALQENKEKEWKFKWTNDTENNDVRSFTANVDIQSRSKRHSLQKINEPDNLNASTESKVRYTRKILGTSYTFNTAADHKKDFKKDLTNITFPQINFVAAAIYPFRWGKGFPQHWYEDISFKHTSEFQNKFTNVVDGDTLDFSSKNWSRILKNGRYGIKHSFPIETNIKLWNYFNLRPFAEYIERWYFRRYEYTYRSLDDAVITDTLSDFNRVWDYKLGAALGTTVYGTHFFKEENYLQAIRHRIEPSLDLTYNPDFSEQKYRYYTKIKTKQGEKVLDNFNGSVYGTPSSKARALLTMQVNNVLETKIRNDEDVSQKSKKIPIFESLSVKTTYDFLADSFPLGDLEFGVRNRFLDSLLSIEYSNKYDPYHYVNRKRVEEYAWQHGEGLGIMKAYTFKVGTHLQSKKIDIVPSSFKKGDDENKEEAEEKETKKEKKLVDSEVFVLLDSTQYVSFDVPWQLDISYQQNFTYNIPLNRKGTTRQITFSGNLNITRSWKATFSSVYDIDKKELVGSATKIGIYRDLHCWQMSFDWVPLAYKQSYEFSIGLKAPILEDVKLPHSREYDKV